MPSNAPRMKPFSRRKFLGKSALAAGLAPLAVSQLGAPLIRSVRAGEPRPNEKIRLGLIGSGGMGKGDLECFFLNPEVDCAVICDVDDAMSAQGVADDGAIHLGIEEETFEVAFAHTA